MATAADLKMMTERRRMLAEFGVAFTPIFNPRPCAQWYKGDGTALPNLLPADPHHIRLYEKRGWTMLPPRLSEPVAAEPVGAVAVAEAAPHIHHYGKTMGSPCKARGCQAVRQTPYQTRKRSK